MSGERKLVRYRGVWCLYWRDGRNKPRRRSLGTTDRAEAERLKRDIEQDALKSAAPSTIGGIVDAFQKDREARGGDESNRRHAWKAASKTFDHLEPHHVTRELCREFTKARRKAGSKDSTIIKQLSLLRAALRWHDPNTPAVVELPPDPLPSSRHLTHEEAARLLDACAVPHIELFVTLALTTGARTGALLDLTWDRIDFDRELIYLGQGRGNKGRGNPPMNESAREALLIAREAAVSDYVIEYAGRQVGSIRRGFASAAKTAGMPDVTPHVLRHTAAVWMAEAGLPMSEISQYLGHSSTAVTERTYARYSPTYLRKAASALEVRSFKSATSRQRAKSLKKLADP